MDHASRLRDLGTIPGLLTLSRVGFAICFPFLVDAPPWALAVVAAAGLSDLLDGWYARKFHLTSATGAVLDPITDKLFAMSVVVSLVAWDKLTILEALLLSTRELAELPLVAWLALDRRARSIRCQEFGANLPGKMTTVLQFGALVAALLVTSRLSWWTLATAWMGVMAACAYWVKFARAMRAADASSHGLGQC